MGKEAIVAAYDMQPTEQQIIGLRRVEAGKIILSFEDFEIEDDEDYSIAAEGLREIKRISKDLEERRKKITQPINVALREFNSWFKPDQDILKKAEAYFKRRLEEYDTLKAEQSRVAMLAAAEASRAGDFDTAHEAAKGIVERPTAQGISHGEYYDYEIEDFAKVPRQYLLVDHDEVKKHIKEAGKNEPTPVPGLRFVLKKRTIARV